MSKIKYIDYKKQQQELFKRTETYAANVRKIYEQSFREIMELVKGTELEDGKPFSFTGYGYADETNTIFRSMYSRVYQQIKGGVQREWLKSNEHNDELVKAVFGEQSIEDNHFARFFKRNMEAMDAFFVRKSAQGGLNLSQKVWNYTGQYKEELEYTLDLAMGQGLPANRVAAQVKKYLQDPDRFYRRFRVKIGEDEFGEPVYGLKWKRRVWDKDADSYKWIDANPKHYHPGRGVYRSSARNAQRLTRTETNIAYRTADYTRWQQLDFVIGIEIKLSNNHTCNGVPFHDICDDLKGVYPKYIKWIGWHPNCRCYCVPKLAAETEVDNMLDNILNDKDPAAIACQGVQRELPDEFKAWVDQNMDRIERAKARGTLPYFVKDNEQFIFRKEPTALEIAKARHDARTKEEAYMIRHNWNERKAVLQYGHNVLRIMSGISDIDTTPLAKALKSSNHATMMTEARKLKALGKEIYSYKLLDDPMAVAHQFSMADAKAVQESVASKLQWIDKKGASSWNSVGELEYRKKKLRFEMKWIEANHYGKAWEQTWQVAYNAYAKELAKVNEALTWVEVKSVMPELLNFTTHTKSKVFKQLYDNYVDAILQGNLYQAQMAKAAAVEKKNALVAAAEKRTAKKQNRAVQFDNSCFSQQRKDAAAYFREPQGANDYFFKSATEDWAMGSLAERKALCEYTHGSAYITEPLRAVPGHFHYYTSRIDEFKRDCEAMTKYLDRCHFRKDTWFKRDENSDIFSSDWHLNLWQYKNNPAALVGKETKIESFLSCGSNRATRFTGTGIEKDVIYNIYAPKGTKATYAEPYNHYGQYDGGWDGVSKPIFLNENEIILQRGSTMRITKAEYTKGMWYIDVEVLAQAPTEILEVAVTSEGFYCKFKK